MVLPVYGRGRGTKSLFRKRGGERLSICRRLSVCSSTSVAPSRSCLICCQSAQRDPPLCSMQLALHLHCNRLGKMGGEKLPPAGYSSFLLSFLFRGLY
uniref:Uncharacterized protein n=1 Tax=Anguilla anguilla TaxID=7936 RepID=A0A0E9XBX6_ANGAN